MKHQGRELKRIATAKGYDIQGLANAIGVSRGMVEKDFKAEKLMRRTFKKYENRLAISYDEFVSDSQEVAFNYDTDVEVKYLKMLLAEKEEIIQLLKNQVRFFPSAAQVA